MRPSNTVKRLIPSRLISATKPVLLSVIEPGFSRLLSSKVLNRIYSKRYRSGVHNSHLVAGQKKLVGNIQGPNLSCFYSFEGCFCHTNKIYAHNLGLCGPNRKLPPATFGPRAVCVHVCVKTTISTICLPTKCSVSFSAAG